jgi:beta-carotene hydroxylase
MFINSPLLFRKIHLAHHASVNTATDPDHFTQSATWLGRWLKSFLILPSYYVWTFRHVKARTRERRHAYLSFSVNAVLLSLCLLHEQGELFFALWFAPSFFGIGILGFLNTAWPHAPGNETDRVRNTRIHYVPRWLQILLCNQNLHLVHHLKPSVPWYEYPEWWRKNKAHYESLGAQVHTYTKRKDPF